MAKVHNISMATAAAMLLVVSMLFFVQPAYAASRDELNQNYQMALINLEAVEAAQASNANEIITVEGEIQQTQDQIDVTREQLDVTATALYKHTRDTDTMWEYVLSSSTFQEVVMRFDTYERIEKYYQREIQALSAQKDQLVGHRQELETRRVELEQELVAAKQAADDAANALAENVHADGEKFHQKQGVDNNCGATSFIVGVNVLLGENRYTDNVAVWSGPGFNGDSTADLAYRGGVWLVANNLSNTITIETVPGDIHTAKQMRDQLEQGYVVIVSSGPASIWQRADGTAEEGVFPDGHWIVFYSYNNGKYFANDSAIDAEKGAGCAYTEEQMQQWLDGRSNHFATVLKKL